MYVVPVNNYSFRKNRPWNKIAHKIDFSLFSNYIAARKRKPRICKKKKLYSVSNVFLSYLSSHFSVDPLRGEVLQGSGIKIKLLFFNSPIKIQEAKDQAFRMLLLI